MTTVDTARGELYFFAIDGALMAVTADRAGTVWNGGQPVALLEPGYDAGSATNGRAYDLSPDGTRFLMLKLPGALGVVPNVIVVQHFNEELKRLAPVNRAAAAILGARAGDRRGVRRRGFGDKRRASVHLTIRHNSCQL